MMGTNGMNKGRVNFLSLAIVLKSLVVFAISICIVKSDNHQITGFRHKPQESNSEQTI